MKPTSEAGQDSFLYHLIGLSIRGLEDMFDEENMLFCYRMKRTDNGLKKEGFSYRYTLISLLGLCQFEAHGFKQSLDVKQTLGKLIDNPYEINNVGDLGLLIWLCALASPERLANVFCAFDVANALKRYGDALQGRTMELSWFLAGLSHGALTVNESGSSTRGLATNTYKLILGNYGGKGIFGHLSKKTLEGRLRGRIASFADQVYPIYALSKFSEAFGHEEAMKIAMDCSTTICRHQGPLGQWWWHYDSATGNLLGRYPVYSVHQDGMAPMALFAVSESSGQDFSEAICKGLEWITGNNELCINLVCASKNLIWRNLYRPHHKMYYDEIVSLIKHDDKERDYKDLRILYECRPYHLGWLLYAFSDKVNLRN